MSPKDTYGHLFGTLVLNSARTVALQVRIAYQVKQPIHGLSKSCKNPKSFSNRSKSWFNKPIPLLITIGMTVLIRNTKPSNIRSRRNVRRACLTMDCARRFFKKKAHDNPRRYTVPASGSDGYYAVQETKNGRTR